MLQLLYWLGIFNQALAILSLVIFLSEKKYKTQITQGFLWLYLNEIIFFFCSFFVKYVNSDQNFELPGLCQLISNVYLIVVYGIVMAWLMTQKREIITKSVHPLSTVFMVFSWMSFFIIACFSLSSSNTESIINLANLSSGLGWVLCLLKLCLQYDHNKSQSIGLSYLFLIFTIGWATCQTIYQIVQEQNSITKKATISVFGLAVAWICISLYIQRRENILLMETNTSQQQNSPIIISNPISYSDLSDSLLDKNKQSDRTNYTSSFGESIQNY